MTTAEQEAREIVDEWFTVALDIESRKRLIRCITAALSSRDESLSAAKAEVERLRKELATCFTYDQYHAGCQALRNERNRETDRAEAAEKTIDTLESNARVQAKLLADTGRAKEAAESRLAEARKVIEGLADDLASEIEARYPLSSGDTPGRDVYPDMRRRYQRDMGSVTHARAFISPLKDAEVPRGGAPSFAGMLKEMREGMDWQQKKLADALGVSSQYICDLESGRRKPSLRVVQRICEWAGRGPKGQLAWHVAGAHAHGWCITPLPLSTPSPEPSK